MLLNQMFIMVFWMFAMGICTFVVRVRAIKNKELKVSHFRTYESKEGHTVPDKVIVFGRHFDNQFQVPLLFLITCVAAQTMPLYSSGYLAYLAWAFVASRMVHSYIHLGSNNVRYRMLSYFFGWFCVLGMWLTMVLMSHV